MIRFSASWVEKGNTIFSFNTVKVGKLHQLGMGIVIFCTVQTSVAAEIFFIPSIFISSRNFEYSVGNGGVDGHISSLGLGLTTTYQNFYVDVAGEKNLVASEESTTNLPATDNIKFARDDVAISIGYAANESVSAFVGYKYGKTTITATAPSPFVGAKISLDGQGIFIGGGGRWEVKGWGFLSFSAAYARMVSNYRDLIISTDTGDASGTSLGVQWKAPLTQNSYYDFSMTRHDYYYENFEKFDNDISEQLFSVRLGFSYRF